MKKRIYIDTSVIGGCYDAVKMMREIRERLRKKYEKEPALREAELKKIHKKYGTKNKSDKVKI